ncbi:MAG: type II secretion system F family protein [Acidobacteria bacterium]|nr:type II secretion system F family protein [Acidobacteriota bacterium]MDW7984611.1 type II secretion system F family protein [Acidobacteriota bacterium]
MPTFEYRGRRGDQVMTGLIEAGSKDEARALLRRQQIIVDQLKEKGREIALPFLRRGVPLKDLAVFTRQFSVMIDAGLPILQCLEILAGQAQNKVFQRTLTAVRDDVEAGSSLAGALRKHPTVFDDLYCNLVAAGEAGGILDTILQRLAAYLEKIVKLRRAVRSALTYPAAVIVIASVVVWVILTYVIPTFRDLFAELGATLPLPTRIVIALSNILTRFGWIVLILLVVAFIAIRRWYKTTRAGRMTIDRFLLHTPILGGVLRKIAVARFCRTMATLISSGVPIIEALEVTAKTSGNAVVEEAILKVRTEVEAGRGIAESMDRTGVFPAIVTHMVSVGEQTGALDTMMNKVAEFYEEEVDAAVEGFMALIEPVMIAFLGLVIGSIVVSMYLPIFGLVSKIG